jgi:hypothetical protein
MIRQYLSNNNETATIAFRQKFLPTKQPLRQEAKQVPHLSRNSSEDCFPSVSEGILVILLATLVSISNPTIVGSSTYVSRIQASKNM